MQSCLIELLRGRIPIHGDRILWLLLSLFQPAAALEDAAAPSLVANHQLQRDDGLFVRWDQNNAWGSRLLVDTIDRVSERMAWLLPTADPLMVGDMSRKGGGTLFGHKTHDTGMDADIGLYLADGTQPLDGFVDVRPSELDLEANWLLIRELLDTGNVHFILLDQRHIDALRTYLLEEKRFPEDWVDDVLPPRGAPVRWSTHGVVRHAPNHRSHLHVHTERAADLL